MLTNRCRRLACCVLLLCGVGAVRAEETGHVLTDVSALKPGDGPVYTDPHDAGDDFVLQGEYVGWQWVEDHLDPVPAGMQVVALGHDQFGASNTIGGLPGDGWFGGERRLFSGERQGGGAQLWHRGFERLAVQPGFATLYDRGGRKLGEFRKVHRVSPTQGVLPPQGAIVLFDGSASTPYFTSVALTEEGFLMAGTQTTQPYTDFQLHAEFRLPFKPEARGQARGNSGFYLQSRYEVQVLDSFGLEGVENECGALYKTRRPDVNMCYPPLSWQTYDLDLTSPRFDDEGNKIADMRISVWQNGVMIHNNVAIPHKTGGGAQEGTTPLPMKLQDHSNPVVYRNIWLIDTTARKHRDKLAMSP